MNIILIEEGECRFSRNDIRYKHIKSILRLAEGDRFSCGIINGMKGEARVTLFNKEEIGFSFTPLSLPRDFEPLILLIGTPRPPVAKRLLKDLTSLGVREISFVHTDLGERSYRDSNIWKNDNFKAYVLEGAQQGAETLLPEVRYFHSLKKAFEAYRTVPNRIISDMPAFAEGTLFSHKLFQGNTVLAIGPERGWSEMERKLFRQEGYFALSLTDRIMRTESAAVLAAGILKNLPSVEIP